MAKNLLDVRDLLAKDETCSTLAIQEVFGDSYLIQHNVIYRNVRSSVLSCGFSYITDPGSELWSDYQLMSLACLEQLMDSKSIPCYPTKRVLAKLNEQHALDSPLPQQFLLMTLALNNHFHESSHALGYHALSLCPDLLNALSDSENEKRVWGSIITEAVANTIEYLAWMISATYIERIFLRFNAPSAYEDPDLRGFAQYVMATFGMSFLFEHVLFSFLSGRLYSDIMNPRRQSDLTSIFDYQKGDEDRAQIGAILLRTAKGLRADYRDVVAPSYFAILGISAEYDRIMARNVNLSFCKKQLRSFASQCFELFYPRGSNETTV